MSPFLLALGLGAVAGLAYEYHDERVDDDRADSLIDSRYLLRQFLIGAAVGLAVILAVESGEVALLASTGAAT